MPKISDHFYSVNAGMCYFYILDAGESLVVFDTGVNPAQAKKGLQKEGLDPDRVSRVFLTHSDSDHAGGLKAFKNARVLLSKLEEPMITRQQPRFVIKYNASLHDYQTLEDRETVTIGTHTIQIISTPGHTPGSACYLVNGSLLVAGDTMRVAADGRISPFIFFISMNHAGNKKSLEKLCAEGYINRREGTAGYFPASCISIILTGHTGVYRRSL